MTILILSGTGRYQDRWHDLTATSVAAAAALADLGEEVVVRSLRPEGVREVAQADLLVVNAGAGTYLADTDGPEEQWLEAFDLLRRYRAGGGPILALHAAANSLEGLEEWPGWVGGRWVPGISMHPPIGEASVDVADPDHPVTQGLSSFSIRDERYSYLDVREGSRVLLTHRYEGRDHALVWVTEQDGARAVYDALGHDVRAYASPERCDLLRREATWLLGR